MSQPRVKHIVHILNPSNIDKNIAGKVVEDVHNCISTAPISENPEVIVELYMNKLKIQFCLSI